MTFKSPCKVNLLLNILGKRADGFHELETVMHPVNLFDRLIFTRARQGIALTCGNPALPIDSTNLVHPAATAFFKSAHLKESIPTLLEKKLPPPARTGR